MTAKASAVPAVTRNIAVVTYLDGKTDKFELRPSHAYEASKTGAEGTMELAFLAVWIAAGRPEGSIEAWLDGVSKWVTEEEAVPPPNGKPRKV